MSARLDYKSLKARQRRERDGYSDKLKLRVHRALSWLDAAEQSGEDWDRKFIFLWIAFNAAYAEEIRGGAERGGEKHLFQQFVDRIVALDDQSRLKTLVWQEYSKSIHTLVKNPYVFQAFWSWKSGDMTEAGWKDRFDKANRYALKALQLGNTAAVLSIVLNRAYTLRNQIIHGGATWQGTVNRPQVRDCARLMGALVPTLITILMDHPTKEWPAPAYPVVKAGSAS